MIEHDSAEGSNIFDDETLDMLEKRREEYIKSNIRGFTVEESMEHVKNEMKKRGLLF